MKSDTTPASTCEAVAERFALGEPLAEYTDHAATCSTCKSVVATATALGTTKHDVDPGMGFAARMTVATNKRIAERKRNRIVGGVAGSVALAAFGVLVMTRGPGALPDRPEPAVAPNNHDKNDLDPTPDPKADDAALRALARFSDVDTNSHLSARWGHIERPLKPYRALVKGTK